nr:hypothetical protein [Nitrosomonas nitrosa]
MSKLKDNLKQWRDSAQIDWFSQFIKAWIPFNAWMTDTYGDLSDRELLDKVKSGSNVVYNRIVPILTWRQAQARGTQGSWQDSTQEAEELRLKIEQLHRLLQSCVVEGRKGRVSFETVDIGQNGHIDEQLTKWKRTFRVQRDQPSKGAVTLMMTNTKGVIEYTLIQPIHDRRVLEDDATFQKLEAGHRTTFLSMHNAVAPRKLISVLAAHGSTDILRFGTTDFIQDPAKVFSALVDVTYSLRNALFHGSITPNEQHNEIYEPAYHIVMRFVRCTI